MHYFFSLFCKDSRIKGSRASLEDQLYCFAVNISQGRTNRRQYCLIRRWQFVIPPGVLGLESLHDVGVLGSHIVRLQALSSFVSVEQYYCRNSTIQSEGREGLQAIKCVQSQSWQPRELFDFNTVLIDIEN